MKFRVILFALTVFCFSCNQERQTAVVIDHTTKVSDKEVAQLMDLDLSQTIGELKTIDRKNSKETIERLGVVSAAAKGNSPGDEAILNPRVLPDGTLYTSTQALMRITLSVWKTGQFPKTGVDLYPELLTQRASLTSWHSAHLKSCESTSRQSIHPRESSINPSMAQCMNQVD